MLDRLASSRGALLARLSGSGPTCFALFREETEAEAAAAELRAEHPDWWVAATMLG
jgi:4-diphosphocytidyl-2-C-methyl-D-erythritol kinase